eukprot:m.79110 g.79110  ORF g.79110 m.79110 type:complete len:309 (-) comp12558_c0_seq1:235-1161(-)
MDSSESGSTVLNGQLVAHAQQKIQGVLGLSPAQLSTIAKRGVLHVVAAGLRSVAAQCTEQLTPTIRGCSLHTPITMLRQEAFAQVPNEDKLLLCAARARASAILTSGANIRAEPQLQWTLGFDEEQEQYLTAWRGSLGLPQHHQVFVLTEQGIPLTHPCFSTPNLWVTVLTTNTEVRDSIQAAGMDNIQCICFEKLSVTSALQFIQRRHSAITIELGPTASVGLYRQTPARPVVIDSLWMSVGIDAAAMVPVSRYSPSRGTRDTTMDLPGMPWLYTGELKEYFTEVHDPKEQRVVVDGWVFSCLSAIL